MGARADRIARQPDDGDTGIDADHLRDLAVQLSNAIPKKSRGRKTVAIGLVEQRGSRTLVYTVSGNWTHDDLTGKAEELGITRWDPTPRASRAATQGAAGRPEDAEQLMIEGANQHGFEIKAIVPARSGRVVPACPDCRPAIDAEEGIQIVQPPPRAPTSTAPKTRKTSVVETPKTRTTQTQGVSELQPGKALTRGSKLRSVGTAILGDMVERLSSALVAVALALIERETINNDIQANVLPKIDPALPGIEPKLEALREDTSKLPTFFLNIKYKLHYVRKTIYITPTSFQEDQGISYSYVPEYIEAFDHSEFDSVDVSRDEVEDITKLKDLVYLVTYSKPLEIELTAEEEQRLVRHWEEQSRVINERAKPKFEECVSKELERPAGIPTEEELTQAQEKCMKKTGYAPYLE